MKANKPQKTRYKRLEGIKNKERKRPMPQIHGERIRGIRRKEKLTQEKLAEILEIDVTTLRKAEDSKSPLPADAAMRLYEEFGYSLDWIYGMSEIIKTQEGRYLVDIRDVVRFRDENIHITIPKKFFDVLAHEDEIKRVRDEIQVDESSVPFIHGVAKQERKFLLYTKNSYYCATVPIQSFEQSGKNQED